MAVRCARSGTCRLIQRQGNLGYRDFVIGLVLFSRGRSEERLRCKFLLPYRILKSCPIVSNPITFSGLVLFSIIDSDNQGYGTKEEFYALMTAVADEHAAVSLTENAFAGVRNMDLRWWGVSGTLNRLTRFL